MRIAFIHPFLYRYYRGIERFTVDLANALAGRGIDVSIVTWRWPQPLPLDRLHFAVHVHQIPTSRYYAARIAVPVYVWHLLTHRYDFVWVYFAGYGEAEALAAVRHQRFGIVFHYPLAQVPHRYREFRRFGLARRAAQIVAVSRFVAEGVRSFLGRDSVVVHHGVDTRRFKPDAAARQDTRRRLNLSPQAPLLLTAAALEERKGVQWVLRALPQVVRDFPDTTYVVVGEGPYRRRLDQIVSSLGLGGCVRFVGARQDVETFYQAADLTLVLSRGEASSLAALESLACAVPVVSARHPPFDELVSPDCGIRVDERDGEQVAGAVIGLLSDPARRGSMGETGLQRIRSDFTLERAVEQYLHLSQT